MKNEKDCRAAVRDFCLQNRLLCPGQPLRLAAAVSGGADSMAMLLLLRALQPEFGYTLSACHVNHGLRGGAADRDEAFVRQACGALGVPLRVFHAAELADTVDAPPPHAGEDWARRLRYACFERLCEEGIDAVATAHTANDQAETLLLRLARGTGLHGAAGIRPRRGCYLRPLLCLNRADTEAVCRAAGQTWVTDETNETDAYARNRLRRAALPALQSTNEAAVENLAHFCEKAAQADAYFAQKAEALLMDARLSDTDPVCWRLEPLAAADAPILETALHRLAAPVRDPEEKYIRLLAQLVQQGSGAVQLTGKVRFCAADGVLRQETQAESAGWDADAAAAFTAALQAGKPARMPLPGGKTLTARVFPADFEEKIQVVHKKDLKNRADYARITTLYAGLVLRTRQPGDVYRPAGRAVHNRLRKWMNEADIPAQQRDTLPLLAAGSEVLWVCGSGFAEGLAPDETTTQILQMEQET